MPSKVVVTQITAEGITLSFLAKGYVAPDDMKKACQAQFVPTQYEDGAIDVERARIAHRRYRWIPARDESGEFCGSQLIVVTDHNPGSFEGTELILNCR